MPDPIIIDTDDVEPERYYDWKLWKMRQERKHKMKDPNKSTQPTETELMAITAEECGELVQVCMKVVRWGIDKKKTDMLIEEAGDVALMIDLLIDHGYITKAELKARKDVKRQKLKRYSNLIKEEK